MATPVATTNSAVSARPHLEKFFERVNPIRARLVFAIDATASREPTWDMAAGLTAQMFETAAAIGTLDIQLVYFRGHREARSGGSI